jgi:membrane-bound inhibitor of C-type lysozyme
MDAGEVVAMKFNHVFGCGAASLFMGMAASPALNSGAPQVRVTVENGSPNMRTAARYDCAGHPVEVEYFNVEPDHLAVVPVEGRKRIFVLVMSGSGARYASGPYIWWSKGIEASLYDQTKGDNAPPVQTCRAAGEM